MEILGLDPKSTIRKIAVLPVKLYPLCFNAFIFFLLKKMRAKKRAIIFFFLFFFYFSKIIFGAKLLCITHSGIEPEYVTVKVLCLNRLTSGSINGINLAAYS